MEVSARTQHGRFLLRPSPEVNDIILGALGRAQARYGVEIYAFVFLSNHFHMLMRVDSAHQMAAFVGYFMSKIAKELGRMHGWREKFWGRRYHSASLEDSARVQQERFLYILRNGCKEDLVDSPLEWPGVSTAHAFARGTASSTGSGTTEQRSITRDDAARLRPHRSAKSCDSPPFPSWQPGRPRRGRSSLLKPLATSPTRRSSDIVRTSPGHSVSGPFSGSVHTHGHNPSGRSQRPSSTLRLASRPP